MASLPQIGLEATIAGMGAFQSAASSIQSTYNQLDKAASNVAKSTTSSFVSLGDGVIGFAQTAATVGVAGIAALTAGIVGLGVVAVGEYAKFERMTLSITNLVAREISQGQMVEQQIQTRISLTKKENEELSQLPQKIKDEELSRKTLAAQIQEQRQKIIDLTASYGENGLNVQTAKARLAEMENEYNKSGSEIDKLNGRMTELNQKNGELTSTLQKVRVGQMSMTDAMAQAAPRAQELLKWIQLLAIESPFTQEGVAVAFQTALTYGFTSEKAQELTKAEIDFAAATGKSESVMGDIAYALGQINARGKVTAHELRMLGTAGIGVNKILEDMGFTLDDVTAGNVDYDKFLNAVIKDMQVFTGAAKQQAFTFSGLFSTLSDIKDIGLREFFGGTFRAIQPYLAAFANTLGDAIFKTGSIKAMGDAIGQYVGGALKTVSDLVAQFQRWGPEGIFAALGFKSSSLFIAQLKSLFKLITSQGPDAKSIFEGIGGVIKYLQQNAFPLLTKAVSFVMNHFEEFKGALTGIGAVLATGVFASIVAGILALLTPINLIIGASALLGAAWAGDWYGIQEATYAVWATVQPILNQIVDIFSNIIQAFQSGGFSGAIAVVTANIALLGNTIQTALVQAWPGIQSTLAEWGTMFWGWVGVVYENIPTVLTSLITSISEFLTQYWPTISATLMEWSGKFWDWAGQAALGVGTAMAGIAVALLAWAMSPEAQTSMSSLGSNLGKMIVDGIKLLFQSNEGTGSILASLASGLVVGIAGIASSLIILGGELVAGILSGILESLGADLQPATVSELGTILAGIGTNNMIMARVVGQNIVKGITDGWNSIAINISTTFKTGIEGWKKVFSTSIDSWMTIGKNIVFGIVKGIKDNLGRVFEVLKDLAKEAVKQAMDFFGESSPSTVFADIGENVVIGFVQGLQSSQGMIQGAYDKLFKINRSVVGNQAIGKFARQQTEHYQENRQFDDSRGQMIRETLEKIFRVNGKEILATADPIAEMQTRLFAAMPLFRKADITKEMMIGSAKAFVVAAIRGTKTAQAELQKMIIAGSESAVRLAGSLTDYAQEEANRLTDQIDTLDYLIEVANGGQVEFEGQIYSTIEAQALYNQKLEEQKRIQDDLIKLQENESKLNLLEKQLDLITQVSKSGLDIHDIFGGIQFGLDASIADVIEATNRVVQAMINQVNSDLQIASPSKVMMKVGAFMNKGLAQGILNTMNLPMQALSNIINVPAGQAGGVNNNSTVNNYNFSMAVNSGAQPQAVIQQYQTMRAMVS